MEYGAMIRELRERHGLSQNDLAKKLGVHKQMISDIERGKQKRFNPAIEQKLIELFDIQSQQFFYDGFEEKSSYDDLLEAHEKVLLHYFRQIPERKRLEVTACLLECIAKHKI